VPYMAVLVVRSDVDDSTRHTLLHVVPREMRDLCDTN
jgi:hypothetical protein